jgi:hypothetical protein
MPNYELLNNIDHKDVKVITERSARYGDNVHFVMTFPTEFRRIQSSRPTRSFFRKTQTQASSSRSPCSASRKAKTCF